MAFYVRNIPWTLWKLLFIVVASNHNLIFFLSPNVFCTPFSLILFREDYILVNCTCFSVFYAGCTSWVYLQHKHLPVTDVCADCRDGLELFNEAQQLWIMGVLSIGTSLWTQKNYEWQWKNTGTVMVNNQGDRIFNLIIHPLNRHLLQLVGCCYFTLVWRDLKALLLPTASVVELVGLKVLLTRNLFFPLAVEMLRLTGAAVDGFFLSDFVADISYKLFIFRARSLDAVVHSRR